MQALHDLTTEEIERIIEMAWEDRTPFEAIFLQFGLRQQDVIALMRKELKKAALFVESAREPQSQFKAHQKTQQRNNTIQK